MLLKGIARRVAERSRGAERAFLTAEWRHLVMLSWRIPPRLVEPSVPRGTALDTWRGACYVSLVGFLFLRTRVRGVPIPFHRDFEEINLRFYIRRAVDGEVRRGVCFVRELVPRTAIAWMARLAYNEPYRSVPMTHQIAGDPRVGEHVSYAWKDGGEWNRIGGTPEGAWVPPAADSHEEFITEHYWGYTRQRDGGTVEYRVRHPRWRVRRLGAPMIAGDMARTYGPEFARVFSTPPDSALLAEGSEIAVGMPMRL